jgi:hypothetical protein
LINKVVKFWENGRYCETVIKKRKEAAFCVAASYIYFYSPGVRPLLLTMAQASAGWNMVASHARVTIFFRTPLK